MNLIADCLYLDSLEVSDIIECIQIEMVSGEKVFSAQLTVDEAINLSNMLVKCAMNNREQKGNK